MKDISTRDHINRLCICIERRVRAQDILSLERSAKNASTVKARQREESAALKALNRHFKDIERLVLNEVEQLERGKSFKKAEKRIRKHYERSQKNSGAT
jgi:hypothetical protein